MPKSRAAYMREYRARRRVDRAMTSGGEYIGRETAEGLVAQADRIRALEAEVARLKRELAAHPALGTFNSRPFTPVPKPGRK